MKFAIALALLAVSADAERLTQLSPETIPTDEGMLMCEKTMEEQWDKNLAGLYKGTSVVEVNAKDAAATLVNGDNANKNPSFVVEYHPQCPHCHGMVNDFIKLADEAKKSHSKVNIMAVNMSTSSSKLSQALEVKGFPTVRLYTAPGEFKDFNGEHRDLAGFKKFLAKNNIKL